MTSKEIKTEILNLEKRYWQAIKDKDIDAAMLLTDYPCIVAGPHGVGQIDREKFESMMKNAPYILNSFLVKDDAKVRLLSDDVAILAYNIHEELTVEGKKVVIDAADSSTWVKRHGRWVCALHTESICGDHYGRDK